MAKSDIFEYVGELEEEIEASRYAKLSKTNKVIDEKIVMEIIGDIKNALHEELDASVKIMAERDQIINAAETQAAEILKKARRDAEAMAKKEEVYKLAYAKANSLLETYIRSPNQSLRRRRRARLKPRVPRFLRLNRKRPEAEQESCCGKPCRTSG